MLDRLKGVEGRFLILEKRLSDPDIYQDREAFERYSREHSELSKIVTVFRELEQVKTDLAGSRDLLQDADPEIKRLATDEIQALTDTMDGLEEELKHLLLPKDPNDRKNVILEIRAGTGGEEAGLFAGDLFRMYSRFAETLNWRVEILSQHVSGVGRDQGDHRHAPRKGRLQCHEIRKRHPSRPAGSGHRGPGAHPHVGRDRCGAARGRGGRRQDRTQ